MRNETGAFHTTFVHKRHVEACTIENLFLYFGGSAVVYEDECLFRTRLDRHPRRHAQACIVGRRKPHRSSGTIRREIQQGSRRLIVVMDDLGWRAIDASRCPPYFHSMIVGQSAKRPDRGIISWMKCFDNERGLPSASDDAKFILDH
jgi:hypothetical protein